MKGEKGDEMSELRCGGCGAVIQSEDKNKPGYLPENALNKDKPLCQRCFKLMHYHQKMESHLSKEDFLKIIASIGDKDCLVVYIVDLFDFNGSLISGLTRHVGFNDILVLGNKRDVLPKSLKDHRLNMWVRRQLKNEGIKPVDVILTSGKKKLNFDEIFDAIEEYRKGRDVYVVGMTNVGKSTFINALLKHYSDVEQTITTSEFPGTTLDLIRIPFDEKSALYDSPGIMNEAQMTSHVAEKDLKTIVPQSELRPMSFQLNAKQTLYMSGLARMDYLEGEKAGFVCYFSRQLKIHRTKMANADALFDNHKELKLYPLGVDKISQMKSYEFSFKKGEKKEVFISGLGFISVNTKGKLRISVPVGVDVFVRECLI
jgi:ribosome biogenesis GTPase YqeH